MESELGLFVVKTFIEKPRGNISEMQNIIYPIRTRNTVAKSHKHPVAASPPCPTWTSQPEQKVEWSGWMGDE